MQRVQCPKYRSQDACASQLMDDEIAVLTWIYFHLHNTLQLIFIFLSLTMRFGQ